MWDRLKATLGRPFVALVGPRGTGKTVLLRQLRAESEDSLYLSADTVDRDENLFDLVQTFHESFGISRFYIDEIHFIRDFPRYLKQIYDFLPVHVWFTSSVALSLTATAWDLARRVTRVSLWPFSFREYLWFTGKPLLPQLSLRHALSKPIPPDYLRSAQFFDSYMQGGLYPFLLEPGADLSLFETILQKVVTQDIPSRDPHVSVNDIETLHKVVRFIGRSRVDGVNYSTVARNVGITKYKAEQYLSYLEDSFVVHRVMPRGSNVLKEPKVLLQLPYRLLFQEYEPALGALREEFFATAMRQHGVDFDYVKSTRGAKTPDYLLVWDEEDTVVEIGGVGKGRTQFKDVTYQRKVVLYHSVSGGKAPQPGERVPLHCIGFA